MDLKGDSFSEIEGMFVDDETVVDEIIDSKYLHHFVDGGKMPPFLSLEQDVGHKSTSHSLKNYLMPPFPWKEGDGIV